MDPDLGRFISRDTIGLWGDESNLGNPYSYCGNNPWSRLDPYGEDDTWVYTQRLYANSEPKPLPPRLRGFLATGPKSILKPIYDFYFPPPLEEQYRIFGEKLNAKMQFQESLYNDPIGTVSQSISDNWDRTKFLITDPESQGAGLFYITLFLASEGALRRLDVDVPSQGNLDLADGAPPVPYARSRGAAASRRTLTAGEISPGMEINPYDVNIYRGGSSLKVREIDFRIDRGTGLVNTTHGASLDIDAAKMGRFEGGAHRLDSIPEDLKIIQRGDRIGHFEIVPRVQMTPDRYRELLGQVTMSPAG